MSASQSSSARHVPSGESLRPTDSISNWSQRPFRIPPLQPLSFDPPDDEEEPDRASVASSPSSMDITSGASDSYFPPPGFTAERPDPLEGATELREPLKSYLCHTWSRRSDPRIRSLFIDLLRILDDPVVKSPLLFSWEDWEESDLAVWRHIHHRDSGPPNPQFPLLPLWDLEGQSNEIIHCNRNSAYGVSDDKAFGHTFKLRTFLIPHPPYGPDVRKWENQTYTYQVTATDMMAEGEPADIINFMAFFDSKGPVPTWDDVIGDCRMHLEGFKAAIPPPPPPPVRKNLWGKVKEKFLRLR